MPRKCKVMGPAKGITIETMRDVLFKIDHIKKLISRQAAQNSQTSKLFNVPQFTLSEEDVEFATKSLSTANFNLFFFFFFFSYTFLHKLHHLFLVFITRPPCETFLLVF